MRSVTEDVKIAAPVRALEAAAAIGAETAERIGGTGARVVGDPAPLPAVPGPQVRRTHAEPRIASEAAVKALYAAVKALYGVPAAAAAAPVRRNGPAGARTVHQTPSEELVKVLGRHCPRRPRRR
ncbi:hypothetical protein ABT301_05205 [Streptomyces sp. NPDC000987]|uniref:hypothetical protein n=1 Tax=Streptomyces sp. NPDC000987 TaxID=3154374 RepID=UPI00331762C0